MTLLDQKLQNVQRLGRELQERIKNQDTFEVKTKLINNILSWPIQDKFRISQYFGENPALYKPLGMVGHNGIDLAVPIGTPVYACDYGVITVIKVDTGGFGLHVKITHDWGMSVYAHLSRFTLRPNCYVSKRQLIGYSGNTGFSTGPHTHFGIKKNGVKNPGYYDYIDPFPFLAVDNYYKKIAT